MYCRERYVCVRDIVFKHERNSFILFWPFFREMTVLERANAHQHHLLLPSKDPICQSRLPQNNPIGKLCVWLTHQARICIMGKLNLRYVHADPGRQMVCTACLSATDTLSLPASSSFLYMNTSWQMELKQIYGWSNTAEKKQAKCMWSMNYK
jgi:hypothetical protein